MQPVRTAAAMHGEEGVPGGVDVDRRHLAGPREHPTLRIEHQQGGDRRHVGQLVAQPGHSLGDRSRVAGAHHVAQDHVDRFERGRGLLGEHPRHVGEVALRAPLGAVVCRAHVPHRRGDVDDDEDHADRDDRATKREPCECRASASPRHGALLSAVDRATRRLPAAGPPV